MVRLFLCTVSAEHPREWTVDLSIPEREDEVVSDVPVLRGFGLTGCAKAGEDCCSLDVCRECRGSDNGMPHPGEWVYALFEEGAGKLERGVVVGTTP